MNASLAVAGTELPVVRIVDRDTVEQDRITYRLHGIDVPEFGQKCGRSPCGKLVVEAMAILAEGKHLECEQLDEDGHAA